MLTVLSVPPETTTSALLKLLPGSSLNLKLICALRPTPSKLLSLLIATVGASVSTLKMGVAPAPPTLPAASL